MHFLLNIDLFEYDKNYYCLLLFSDCIIIGSSLLVLNGFSTFPYISYSIIILTYI